MSLILTDKQCLKNICINECHILIDVNLNLIGIPMNIDMLSRFRRMKEVKAHVSKPLPPCKFSTVDIFSLVPL
ncbi:hypothetical protein DICVIV_06714 [Dictyocaulus viviparus]|uniref:Uncharacterized protein n=1 Tax=Dictyocaulus viviparus TaxID=29172 RepID=A0A0D8XRC0_DICVI|nr:hypothetical protein DICVIV_06714 [Dictyocaulus viviparus]